MERGRRAVAEELVTVLAHDLRNYLQPIQLRLSLLRRRAEGDERESDQRDIEASLKGLAQLSGLVSNILDVARIDQGMFSLNVGPVDIVELLHEIALPLSTPEHPVHMKAFEQMVVIADAARARQCLENLLANALKHSPEGASVTAEVLRDLRPSGTWAIIDVIDEGPGISQEVMPHLFERFVTGQSDKGGLGLGLYLAKRIAVLHGGDLIVESTPGQGARFRLTLPALE